MSIGLTETHSPVAKLVAPRSRALSVGVDIGERALVTLTFIYFLAANFDSGSLLNVVACLAEAITCSTSCCAGRATA